MINFPNTKDGRWAAERFHQFAMRPPNPSTLWEKIGFYIDTFFGTHKFRIERRRWLISQWVIDNIKK